MPLISEEGWVHALVGALATLIGATGIKFIFRLRVDARKDKLDSAGAEAQMHTWDQLIAENQRLATQNEMLDRRINDALVRAWNAEEREQRLIREIAKLKHNGDDL